MTPAGLRSLFRHHRRTTGVKMANPHRFRHTFASDMVRAGVSLPALMTLLGHVKAEMTMKYVLVVGDDLQREFHLARSQPRHLVPQPKAPIISPRAGLEGVIDSLLSPNTQLRCSVAPCRTALADIVSISSPIG